jgi:hypothetical protein
MCKINESDFDNNNLPAELCYLGYRIVAIFQSMDDDYCECYFVSVYKSCLIKDSKIKKYPEIEDYLQASHKLAHIPLLKPRQAHGPVLRIKQFVSAHVPSGI